jgi:hypothetical protein
MTSFDPNVVAKAMRRLVTEVERLKARVDAVEDENGRLRRANDELACHLRGVKLVMVEKLRGSTAEEETEQLAAARPPEEGTNS